MRAPGLRLHPRTMTVQHASNELHGYLLQLMDTHDLTWAELAVILTERQQSALKYVLRAERHPDDPERKADEE